jgi:hypothetical protein
MFSVLILLAQAETKSKEVSFADLRKLAYDTVKQEGYPEIYKPNYIVKTGTKRFRIKGVLYPCVPRDEASRGKHRPDAETRILLQLMRVAKFSVYPPKEMESELKAITVKDAEKKIKEGYDYIREKKLAGTKLDDHLKKLDYSVNGILNDGIRAYAKKRELEVLNIRIIADEIKVKTNPKGGKVYCITMFQKRLMELQGKDPEIEVMNFSISESIPYIGWVYYVVTWDDGKKKVGPKRRLVESQTVTFD